MQNSKLMMQKEEQFLLKAENAQAAEKQASQDLGGMMVSYEPEWRL